MPHDKKNTRGSDLPHIVIIGCGFGGIQAAKALHGKACRITLIDRTNHHLFQPLLYQVATAGLASPAIAAPIRHIFRKQANVCVLLNEVDRIDVREERVFFRDNTPLAYDALIVATGASHSYFGRDDWATHAPGLKTLSDAMIIRQRMLQAFELAELRAFERPDTPQPSLNFVVIGAGPTGVEMAGTFAEIARHTLKREFRHIDPSQARVLLLEGGPKVLASFSDDLSAKAMTQLQALGVDVMLNARVTDVRSGLVQVAHTAPGAAPCNELITSDCTVWAAGVQASSLGQCLGVALDRAGRVPVTAQLAVDGLPAVFVIGDLAAATSNGKHVPGVSPAAKQMGRVAAHNALASIEGRPLKAFEYVDYGSLATIGRKSAIAQIGPVKLSGLPAWLFWLFVHIFFLIGFKNRLLVMAEWAWSYVTLARSARVYWRSDSADR